MPADTEHLATVSRFERFAQDAQNNYPGWAITALFYAALHYAEAYFYLDPTPDESQHYQSHGERIPAIRRRLPEIESPYRLLQIASEAHRYQCKVFHPSDYQVARSSWYEPLKIAMEARMQSLRS